MRFVLDNSVSMRWFFGDGKPQELIFAEEVLDALRDGSALVPVTWGLEVSNVIAKAEAKGLVTEARSETFLGMLEAVDIEVDDETFRDRCLGHFSWPDVTVCPPMTPLISNWLCVKGFPLRHWIKTWRRLPGKQGYHNSHWDR